MSAIVADTAARLYRRGALLVGGAILLWSSAGLLSRLVTVDPWTTLFWRSVFSTLFLAAFLLLRDGRRVTRTFAQLGWVGVAIGVCFAASMICFITALGLTSVAAVLVFQAASPLFAAVLAWLFLRERVAGVKLFAILMVAVGVGIIVSADTATSSLRGNLLAAGMGVTFAATVVLTRLRAEVNSTAAAFLAVLIVALVAWPMARMSVSAPDMVLLAIFGIGQMGVALIMFTEGVRLIPAADAGLISVLEAVLAPLWVWLALGENPGQRILLGGAVVLAAVVIAARAEARPGR